eukprot:Opistho-2@14182
MDETPLTEYLRRRLRGEQGETKTPSPRVYTREQIITFHEHNLVDLCLAWGTLPLVTEGSDDPVESLTETREAMAEFMAEIYEKERKRKAGIKPKDAQQASFQSASSSPAPAPSASIPMTQAAARALATTPHVVATDNAKKSANKAAPPPSVLPARGKRTSPAAVASPAVVASSAPPAASTAQASKAAVPGPSASAVTKACAVCGLSGVRLSRCGRCVAVYYCGKEHQAEHWPQHKTSCRKPDA